MGMDVYGIGNKAAYFRASVWQWRALHCLIVEANQRFALGLSREGLALMQENAGAGLLSPGACGRLAEALERLIAENPAAAFHLDADPSGGEGEVLKVLESLGWQIVGPCGGYRIETDHVREFVEFLRSCGGFEVW